jgi:hypothetical protein
MVGGRRAALRRGEDLPVPTAEPQKSMLISVPLFHVTGSTSLTVGGYLIFYTSSIQPCSDACNYGGCQNCFDAQVEYSRRSVVR